MLTLTKQERAFCEAIKNDGCYIARNKSGRLALHCLRPDKGRIAWTNKSAWLPLNKDFFPFIIWEDDEPWSIEDLLKLEVEEI